jgi:holo-[acyl-carrier protein] synthase
MILGLGIDLLETSRVERSLSGGRWPPEDGIFTPAEIGRGNSALRPAEYYAACFAAKEAALKALDLPVDDLAMFLEIEVEPDSTRGYRLAFDERPKVKLEQVGARHASLSITFYARHVGATVILEG